MDAILSCYDESMFTIIALLTFVASFIGTLAGFGVSTIMLPVVILFFPLPQSLLLVALVHFFNDIWEMFLFKGKPHWRILLIFGTTGVIASIIGANLAVTSSPLLLSRILGGILIVFVVVLGLKKNIKFPKSNVSLAFGGTLSGFLAGVFGIGGFIRSLFLSHINLTKKEYIFTIGAVSFLVEIARILTYVSSGAHLPAGFSYNVLLLIPVSLFAAEIAKLVVNRIPQKAFQQVISLFLIFIGLKFLLFP